MDEWLALHERLNDPLRTAFDTQGLLYFPWVIVGGSFAGAIGLSSICLLSRLPRPIAGRMLAAGLSHGRERLRDVGGWQFERAGALNLTYDVLTLGEETLEMVGVLLFLEAVQAIYLSLQGHGDRDTDTRQAALRELREQMAAAGW